MEGAREDGRKEENSEEGKSGERRKKERKKNETQLGRYEEKRQGNITVKSCVRKVDARDEK